MSSDTSEDETNHVTEARQMAMRTIENWDYLNDEEKYGTLHEIVDQLAKAETENSCDECGSIFEASDSSYDYDDMIVCHDCFGELKGLKA